MLAIFKKGSFWPEFTEIPSQSLIRLYWISVLWNLKKVHHWIRGVCDFLFHHPRYFSPSRLQWCYQVSQNCWFRVPREFHLMIRWNSFSMVACGLLYKTESAVGLNWVYGCFVLQQFVAWQLVVLESLIEVSWLQILWSTVRGLTVVATHSTWFGVWGLFRISQS